MKIKIFALIVLALLTGIIYQVRNSPPNKTTYYHIQKEEAVDELYDVFYQAINKEDEEIIDLLWLQQAAKIVEEAGGNYFNVIEQRMGTNIINNEDLSYLEGVIEMTDDIQAEYNASEINSIAIEELN